MADNPKPLDNPFLPKISIRNWEPDAEIIDELDKFLDRATGGGAHRPAAKHIPTKSRSDNSAAFGTMTGSREDAGE